MQTQTFRYANADPDVKVRQCRPRRLGTPIQSQTLRYANAEPDVKVR